MVDSLLLKHIFIELGISTKIVYFIKKWDLMHLLASGKNCIELKISKLKQRVPDYSIEKDDWYGALSSELWNLTASARPTSSCSGRWPLLKRTLPPSSKTLASSWKLSHYHGCLTGWPGRGGERPAGHPLLNPQPLPGNAYSVHGRNDRLLLEVYNYLLQ
jgi:hypothetical protein